MLSSDFKHCTVPDSRTQEALQHLHDLMYRYNLDPTPDDLRKQSAMARFQADMRAMMSGIRADLVAFEAITGFAWDIAPYPKGSEQSFTSAIPTCGPATLLVTWLGVDTGVTRTVTIDGTSGGCTITVVAQPSTVPSRPAANPPITSTCSAVTPTAARYHRRASSRSARFRQTTIILRLAPLNGSRFQSPYLRTMAKPWSCRSAVDSWRKV